MRRTALIVATAAIVGLSACGGSEGDTSGSTAAPVDTEAAADTTAAAATTTAAAAAPADTTAAAPADTTAAAAAGASTVDLTLVEWAIEGPTGAAAGPVTMNVTNGGQFPHELVVIQGESYDALPLNPDGSVIEDQLPAGTLIAETARLDGGASETLSVELAAGSYVLLCNIVGGGSSHAARGQVLEFDVA